MLDRLRDIGFERTEITVLEYLLKNGDKTILELSKGAGINRSHCYEVLDKLLKRGVITQTSINGRRYWKALSKDKILTHIDSIRNDVEDELSRIEKSWSGKGETEISVYEGKKGIRSLCYAIIESGARVIGFGAEGRIQDVFPYEYKRMLKEIEERDTHYELITLKDTIPVTKHNTRLKSFRKQFPSCVEINVYGDKTVLFFWKENPHAIEITDPDVANSFRNIHSMLWKSQ